MRSFDGIGGQFDDIEFCDSCLTDPASGDAATLYPWWHSFAEGKRFYVPNVSKLNDKLVVFNVKELTALGKHLLESHPALYPSAANFGRQSFEKIVGNKAMTYAKAVLATRTVNAYLERSKIKDGNGEIVHLGKGSILVSGYRIEGFGKALDTYMQKALKLANAESATQYVARASGVSAFIIEELHHDDGMFVVAPTATSIIEAMLGSRNLFGISTNSRNTLLRLGPVPGERMRFSVLETGDTNENKNRVDPKFVSRATQYSYANNPYRSQV